MVTTALTILTSSSLWGAIDGVKYVGWVGFVISLILLLLMIYQLQGGPASELEKLKTLQRRVGLELNFLGDPRSAVDPEFRARLVMTEAENELPEFHIQTINQMSADERQKWEQSHLQ
jgi:hypothetical protein